MKFFLLNVFTALTLLFFARCYTQLQVVDRGQDTTDEHYAEQTYYLDQDTTENGQALVNNYYYFDAPYAYDYGYNAYWNDPWYWRTGSRWGFYVDYNWGWDPYGYPWSWRFRTAYPYVTAAPWYYGWGYSYWDPYNYWYYPGYTHHPRKQYAKRPFDRRSESPVRRITRGGTPDRGTPASVSDTRRIIRRGAETGLTNRSSADNGNRRIINSRDARRVLRSNRTASDRQVTGASGRSAVRSGSRSAVSNRRDASKNTRPSYRKPSRTRSSGSSYSPRRSSGRSSSRSAVRRSSGRSSSSSSKGSSSRGSSSRSSSSRSSKRK